MSKRLIVSDHAVIRYLERVGGFNIERLRQDIAARLQPFADAGARGVVIDKHSFLIDDGEHGPVVVMVLPVASYPRNLMGGRK